MSAPRTIRESLGRPARRLLFGALPCAVSLFIFYYYEARVVRWPIEYSGYPAFRDFSNLWAGAVSALHGRLDAVFDRELHAGNIGRLLHIPPPPLMWSYPPTALLLVLPFGLLSFPLAAGLWSVCGLSGYMFAVGLRNVEWRDRSAWIAAVAISPGVVMCFAYGQTAFLTSAAFVAGLLQAQRRPFAAGVCLGLLAAKPQIAIVVPVVLAAMGAWRAFAATAFFASLLVGLSVAVFGVAAWQMFIDITLPQQLGVLNAQSFLPVMMISPYFLFRELGASPPLSYALQIGISLFALCWLFFAIRNERNANTRVLMAACAALLVSAYMQSYELPLLVAAVAAVCASKESALGFDRRGLDLVIVAATSAMFVAWVVTFGTRVNFTPMLLLALLGWLGWRASTAAGCSGVLRLLPLSGRQA